MENYKKIYKNMLDEATKMRKAFITEYGDLLAFGEDMPADAKSDLQASAKITGIVFDALVRHGVELGASTNKPGFYEIILDGEAYSCHKSTIPSLATSAQVNVAPKPAPVAKPEPIAPAPFFEPEPEPEPTPAQFFNEVEDNPVEENEEVFFEEDDGSGVTSNNYFEESSETEDIPVDEIVEEAEEASEVAEEEDESASMPEPPSLKAEVIGDVKVTPMLTSDVFIEAKEKPLSEIVYEIFDITVAHSGYGGGGKAEEMRITVAPLKIVKQACPSVPIIVSVLHRGRVYTKSSYDVFEEGKNLVTIDVSEFYLLCRGSFDANGVFHAIITTTGISANQGDILNLVGHKTFGDATNRNTKNGHIKFRYMSDNGPGSVEVFPADEPGTEEFLIMTKNDEFVDYLYVSNSRGRGSKRAIIFDDDVKKEVVCSWVGNGDDEEVLSVDLVEV